MFSQFHLQSVEKTLKCSCRLRISGCRKENILQTFLGEREEKIYIKNLYFMVLLVQYVWPSDKCDKCTINYFNTTHNLCSEWIKQILLSIVEQVTMTCFYKLITSQHLGGNVTYGAVIIHQTKMLHISI